jgi:hypothetical protein
MQKMNVHFESSSQIDKNFSKMLSFIQIMDPELYNYMNSYDEGDRFYFGYRWYLLDFKRELKYDDIFGVWETIWCSSHVYTDNFSLFIALALILTYRQIIVENSMNYTDMIKFFNEMAEKHNVGQVVQLARSLVVKLIDLVENDKSQSG